ncbi:MAG: lipoprotein [Pseudomonadota bacterium]|nr:lipoprotein [Pseudomonadota bacterium]
MPGMCRAQKPRCCAALVLMMLLASALAGCGQKGPLYRDVDRPAATTTSTEPAETAEDDASAR